MCGPDGILPGTAMPATPVATAPAPGAIIVWTGSVPTVQVYRVPDSGLVIGRELLKITTDDRISRQHARVLWRERRFVVQDLGSRNGTYAGGHALIDREVAVHPPSVVRTGRTVAVLLEDVTRFEGRTLEVQLDAIVGASTAPMWEAADRAAREDKNLLVIGEPGSGKGRLARGYAQARGKREAVFNPTIHAVPLERVATAQVETLILEQIGKLGAANLATLTKLLDTRPALRIATTSALSLDQIGIPAALAIKLAGSVIHMPPLRERPDELAQLVYEAVRTAEPGLQIHSTLIEACLLRPWPGNSRELVAEVSRAAHTVATQGKNNIRAEDLDNEAGHLMIGAPTLSAAATPTEANKPRKRTPTRNVGNE